MKKCLALLMVLALAACIDVEDFGPAWDKTFVDPDIAGSWLRLRPQAADMAHDYPEGQRWIFLDSNSAYSLHTHIDGKKDDPPVYPVKTLAAGAYRFLASGEWKGPAFAGAIIRYALKDGVLTLYTLNFEDTGKFLEKTYPHAHNIGREPGCRPTAAQDCPVRITRFDDDVLEALAGIPDEPNYWRAYIKLGRLAN